MLLGSGVCRISDTPLLVHQRKQKIGTDGGPETAERGTDLSE